MTPEYQIPASEFFTRASRMAERDILLSEMNDKGSAWGKAADAIHRRLYANKSEAFVNSFTSKWAAKIMEGVDEEARLRGGANTVTIAENAESQITSAVSDYLDNASDGQIAELKQKGATLDYILGEALLAKYKDTPGYGKLVEKLSEKKEEKVRRGIPYRPGRRAALLGLGAAALGTAMFVIARDQLNAPAAHAASTPEPGTPGLAASATPTPEPSVTPTPKPTETPRPTETPTPVDPLVEELKNPDFRVGPISLEDDFTIIFPEEVAKLAGFESELRFNLRVRPVFENTEKDIPQDVYDEFADYNNNPDMAIVYRTDRPRNNFVVAHDVTDDAGNPLPLEVIRRLSNLSPDEAKKAYYYIEQDQDGKVVRVRMDYVDMLVKEELDLRSSMANYSGTDLPVIYWTDSPSLEMRSDARQEDILTLVTCTGELNPEDSSRYSQRILFSSKVTEEANDQTVLSQNN